METQCFVIVSRHAGAMEWLRAHHPEMVTGETRVITGNAVPADVQGNIVVGTLPMHLAVLAREYWALDLDSNVPRGVELTREVMEQYHAHLTAYVVLSLEHYEQLAGIDRVLPAPNGMEVVQLTSSYYGSHEEYDSDEKLIFATTPENASILRGVGLRHGSLDGNRVSEDDSYRVLDAIHPLLKQEDGKWVTW